MSGTDRPSLVIASALVAALASSSTRAAPPATPGDDEPAPVAAPEDARVDGDDGVDPGPAPSSDAAALEAAAEPSNEELLANAERLLARGKPALARDQVAIIVESGGLDPALAARAAVVDARARFALGDAVGAKGSYLRAFVGGAVPPQGLPPDEDALAREARAAADGALVATAERAALARPGVVVHLALDRHALVTGARPAGGDATTPLGAQAPVAFLPVDEAAPSPSVWLLDAAGNALVALPVGAPRADVEEAGALPALDEIPWLTVAGGAVILVGAAGTAAAGTLVALADRGSTVVTPDLKLPLLGGVAAGMGLVVVGGVLVVVDVLLAPGRAPPAAAAPTIRD